MTLDEVAADEGDVLRHVKREGELSEGEMSGGICLGEMYGSRHSISNSYIYCFSQSSEDSSLQADIVTYDVTFDFYHYRISSTPKIDYNGLKRYNYDIGVISKVVYDTSCWLSQ